MHAILRRSSLWLSRGAMLLFVASSALRFDSHGDGLYFAWVLVYVPVGAFVAWVQFLFGGFDSRTLAWASLMTLVTLLNAFFFLVTPLRSGVLEERAGLVSVLLGLAIVTVVVLFEAIVDWPKPHYLGLGPLAWIASFVLMSASWAASHFAQSSSSSSTSVADHD